MHKCASRVKAMPGRLLQFNPTQVIKRLHALALWLMPVLGSHLLRPGHVRQRVAISRNTSAPGSSGSHHAWEDRQLVYTACDAA